MGTLMSFFFPVTVAGFCTTVDYSLQGKDNLVANCGFEEEPDINGYPPGYMRLGGIEYAGVLGEGIAKVIDGGRDSAHCLEVIKTNDGGRYEIRANVKKEIVTDKQRRYLAVWWCCAAPDPLDNFRPYADAALYDVDWNGVGSVGQDIRAIPYASGWAKNIREFLVEPGKTITTFRLEVVGKAGQRLLIDDIGLYYITDWSEEQIANALEGAGGSDVPQDKLISGKPPIKGNLLRNSSFELGYHHIWGITHRPHERQLVDDTVAFHGRGSIRLSVSPDSGNSLAAQFVRIKPFCRYTVSAYVRSSKHGARLTIKARSGYVKDRGAAPYAIQNTVIVGTAWQRISATGAFGYTPGSACSVSIEVTAPDECFVWVDAVQLEEGDLSDYMPAHPIEVALSTDHHASIFFEDEPRTVRLRAVNHADVEQSENYRLIVLDYWRNEVFREEFTLTLAAREELERMRMLPDGRKGSLRVQVWRLLDDSLEDELIVSVLPRPLRTGLWSESTIGNHLGFDPYILKVGQMIGIHWSRAHDASTIAHWDVREPEEGKFVWADEEVNRALTHGILVLPVLEKVPTWQGKERWAYPLSLDAWRKFVKAMVEHYRDRITHWDIWNEGWGLTGEQYGNLVVAAKEAAMTVDKDAKILFEFSTWQGKNFVEGARAVNAIAIGDIVCTHIYTHKAWRIPDEPGTGWTLSHNIALLKDWLFVLNANKELCSKRSEEDSLDKQLWMTEAGVYHDAWRSDIIINAVDTPYSRNPAGAAHLTAEEAARYIPRYYATWRANSGDKWFYYWSPYIPSHVNPNSYVFLECDGSLHPMGVANAVCAHELDGSDFVQTIDYGDVNLKCHLFDQVGEGVAILWWQGSGEKELYLQHLDVTVDNIDMMGNKTKKSPMPTLILNNDPIYLRRNGLGAQELAAKLSPQAEKVQKSKPKR